MIEIRDSALFLKSLSIASSLAPGSSLTIVFQSDGQASMVIFDLCCAARVTFEAFCETSTSVTTSVNSWIALATHAAKAKLSLQLQVKKDELSAQLSDGTALTCDLHEEEHDENGYDVVGLIASIGSMPSTRVSFETVASLRTLMSNFSEFKYVCISFDASGADGAKMRLEGSENARSNVGCVKLVSGLRIEGSGPLDAGPRKYNTNYLSKIVAAEGSNVVLTLTSPESDSPDTLMTHFALKSDALPTAKSTTAKKRKTDDSTATVATTTNETVTQKAHVTFLLSPICD